MLFQDDRWQFERSNIYIGIPGPVVILNQMREIDDKDKTPPTWQARVRRIATSCYERRFDKYQQSELQDPTPNDNSPISIKI